MKTLKINEYATLTTEHPASSYGIPVLVTADGKGYGPADKTYPDKFNTIFGGIAAAHSVHSYAISNDLDDDTRDFIKRYLRQWPEGPQI
jgi:hypothetical protein